MKFSDEQIVDAVKKAKSIAEAARLLGAGQSGSSWKHLKERVERLGLNTDHFVRGNAPGTASAQKKTPEEILKIETARRQHSYQLRRALIESGVPYRCSECKKLPVWNGKPLKLEVEHKNGNALDNRKENLEFLCPNCHSQRPIDYKREHGKDGELHLPVKQTS